MGIEILGHAEEEFPAHDERRDVSHEDESKARVEAEPKAGFDLGKRVPVPGLVGVRDPEEVRFGSSCRGDEAGKIPDGLRDPCHRRQVSECERDWGSGLAMRSGLCVGLSGEEQESDLDEAVA